MSPKSIIERITAFKPSLTSETSPPSTGDLENSPNVGDKSLNKSPQDLERYLVSLRGMKNIKWNGSLFWFQTFGGSEEAQEFGFQDGIQFDTGIKKLCEVLGETSLSFTTLQLCILNTSPAPEDIFTWYSRATTTAFGKTNALLAIPRCIIAKAIEETWGSLSDCAHKGITKPNQLLKLDHLSRPEFRRQITVHKTQNCDCKELRIVNIKNTHDARPLKTSDGIHEPQETKAPKLSLDLPSQRHVRNSQTAESQIVQCERALGREAASFSFTWQRTAPIYKGGFDAFLWERYNEPPRCDYAEIFYQDDRSLTSDYARRVLMTVSTNIDIQEPRPQLLAAIKERLQRPNYEITDNLPSLKILTADSPRKDVGVLTLVVVFEQAIADTALFLQEADDEVMKLSYAGRSASSAEKVRYLCHLDDCRKSSLEGMEQIQSVVRDLISILKCQDSTEICSPNLCSLLEMKEEDLEYLKLELSNGLANRIKNVSMEIKEHRTLTQATQTSVLTFIATVYVPFSCLAGLLSMQVRDPSEFFHHFHKNKNNPADNTTTDLISAAFTPLAVRQLADNATSTPTPTPNSTIAAILTQQLAQLTALNTTTSEANASPSSYVWPFALFVGTAIFLLFCSLLLPLVGPNLLRIIVQRSYKIRNVWVFWPIVFLTYYISIYWVLPEIMAAYLQCGDVNDGDPGGLCDNGSTGYYYTEDFASAAFNPINFITYIVSATVMGSIALGNIVVAIMKRRGLLIYAVWFLFGAVVTVVYFLDWYFPTEEYYPFAIGSGLSISALVPLLYLLVVWGVTTYREKKKRR